MSRHPRAYLVLVLTVLAGAGCQERTGSIEGRILNAVTFDAVSEATVSAESRKDGSTLATTSDTAGGYAFRAIESGPYKLVAGRAAFLNAELYTEVFPEEVARVDLSIRPTVDEVEWRVSVTTLSAATREPVVEAQVDLFTGPAPGTYFLQQTLKTDEAGRVEFEVGKLAREQALFGRLQVVAVGFLNASFQFQLTFDHPTRDIEVVLTPI